MFVVLLYLHIISAIISIGPFFVLFPFLQQRNMEDDKQLGWMIDTFRFVVRLSKHAGHVLVGSGILLVWFSGWTWNTPWILATTIILVCSLYFFARAFSPLLRKLGETPAAERAPLLSKLRGTLILYLFLLFLMMWFMVAKPSFPW